MKLNKHIHIERDENGDYRIIWSAEFSKVPVDIYASDTPHAAQKGNWIHRSDKGAAHIDNLREPKRHYFHLVPEGSAGVTMGERALPVRGGNNFRDFGGYLTEDGKQVEWGMLYRSGHLSDLDDDDERYLASLGIRKNCDFRLTDDVSQSPNLLPEDTQVIGLDVDAGSFSSFFKTLRGDQLNEAFMVEVMRNVNRELVRKYQHKYRQMFDALLALEEGAFLVNCTAGKDRTGFAVALILSALGVPRETILHDYLLSARYFKAEREQARSTHKYSPEELKMMANTAVQAIGEARPEYLQAAFDDIDASHGTVEQFLEDAYGVGRQERRVLQERYTR